MSLEFARCASCGREQSILNSMYCNTCAKYVCHLCFSDVCPVCNTSSLIPAEEGPTDKRTYGLPEVNR
jgi:hypothetical protein